MHAIPQIEVSLDDEGNVVTQSLTAFHDDMQCFIDDPVARCFEWHHTLQQYQMLDTVGQITASRASLTLHHTRWRIYTHPTGKTTRLLTAHFTLKGRSESDDELYDRTLHLFHCFGLENLQTQVLKPVCVHCSAACSTTCKRCKSIVVCAGCWPRVWQIHKKGCAAPAVSVTDTANK